MPAVIRKRRINPEKLNQAREFRQKMTPEENLIWEQLRGNKLNGLHFRRQQVIDGYIVDFYCHSARLVLEIDGPIHDSQKKEDKEREQALTDNGLKILRIKNEEIQVNMDQVLAKIQNVCRETLPDNFKPSDDPASPSLQITAATNTAREGAGG